MNPLLSLLMPPVCLACNKRIERSEEIVCEDCRQMVATIIEGYCEKCGSLLEDGECRACAEHSYSFDLCRGVFRYGDVIQSLIHQLKYTERASVAKWLGEAMAEYLETNPSLGDTDAILPVPLHPVRRRERGYNQSELIAHHLSRASGIPLKKWVKRKVYTRSQTLLSKQEREQNLKDAFGISNKASIKGKKLLLVDDVFTTGTTVDTISSLLKDNGAQSVKVITAARA